MKTPALLLFLLASSHGFSPTPASLRRHSTELGMAGGSLIYMFKKPEKKAAAPSAAAAATAGKKSDKNWIEKMINGPIHFHGNGEEELDDLYAEQQKIHRDRQGYKKDKMRSKYRAFETDHLRDIETIKHDPADLNRKEDDAMWVDDLMP